MGRGGGSGNGDLSGLSISARYRDSGSQEGMPCTGKASRAAHDGTCVLAVENEAEILVNPCGNGGFEFASGLGRGFGNL